MPKIVENLRARAIREAKRILTAPEDTAFTMRGRRPAAWRRAPCTITSPPRNT